MTVAIQLPKPVKYFLFDLRLSCPSMPLTSMCFNLPQCLPLRLLVSFICSIWIHNQSWKQKIAFFCCILFILYSRNQNSWCVHNRGLRKYFKKYFAENKSDKNNHLYQHLTIRLFFSSLPRHHLRKYSTFLSILCSRCWKLCGMEINFSPLRSLFTPLPSKFSWSYIPPGTQRLQHLYAYNGFYLMRTSLCTLTKVYVWKRVQDVLLNLVIKWEAMITFTPVIKPLTTVFNTEWICTYRKKQAALGRWQGSFSECRIYQ